MNNITKPDNTIEEMKQSGINCGNQACRFYDNTGTFEQRCSGGDESGNPVIPYCSQYTPECVHDLKHMLYKELRLRVIVEWLNAAIKRIMNGDVSCRKV